MGKSHAQRIERVKNLIGGMALYWKSWESLKAIAHGQEIGLL